jgi:hypothetical protein
MSLLGLVMVTVTAVGLANPDSGLANVGVGLKTAFGLANPDPGLATAAFGLANPDPELATVAAKTGIPLPSSKII